MKLFSYLGLFAGLLSAASALEIEAMDTDEDFAPLHMAEKRAGHCVKGVHVIAVGGQGATRHNLGYLQSLTNKIVRRIPHSAYYQVAYPPNQANGSAAVAYGVPALHRHIKSYARRCPHSHMVTIGYSIGAAVVMDTLCGAAENAAGQLAKKYRHKIIANVVYGDLTFIPHQKWNRGTCHKHGDVPRQKPGGCFPYGGKTRSYCDRNDPECCSGNDEAVHFSYPDKYDGVATDFVQHRWQRYKKHHKKHHKHH